MHSGLVGWRGFLSQAREREITSVSTAYPQVTYTYYSLEVFDMLPHSTAATRPRDGERISLGRGKNENRVHHVDDQEEDATTTTNGRKNSFLFKLGHRSSLVPLFSNGCIFAFVNVLSKSNVFDDV